MELPQAAAVETLQRSTHLFCEPSESDSIKLANYG